ncbi:MAG: MFS transporter [Negativicutes bacterium]|nr:MFS transporter [Negativicutes bacterium]
MLIINRNFGLLWFGQLVSQVGDKAYNIVLMWWLLEKTASPIFVSSFLIASLLPELIFGPVAGVYIDRWNKKRILVAADFIRGIVVLTLAVLYQLDMLSIGHIYIAALFISFCSALFNPTTMAVIPLVVAKKELQRANALSQMVAGAVAIIGPLLGASGMAFWGYVGVLVFNGCSYILSGIAAMFLRIGAGEVVAKESVFSALAQGFRYIWSDERVSVVVIVVAVIHVFVGSIVVVMPFLAPLLAGSGIHNLGVLQAALGGGMIIGAVYVSKYGRGYFSGLTLFCAIAVMGVGIVMLGTLQLIHIRFLVIYAVCCIIIGMCIAVVSVFWRTIAQICVPEDMTGRVFSVLSTTGNISLPISMAIFGVLLNYVAPASLLVFAGVCLLLIGIVLVYNIRPIFEGLRL